MEALPVAMLPPAQPTGSFEARTSRLQEVRNAVIRVKMGVKQKILEVMENNMLKCYGHAVSMEYNRCT